MANSRGHCEISPSSAHRWMACPGSVRLCRGISRPPSEYMVEGTAAHEVAERCLRNGTKPESFLGSTIVGVEVTHDMVRAVTQYVEYVEARSKGRTLWLEQKVDLQALHPPVPMFGFADAILVGRDGIEVVDYKHGRGVLVSPDDNPQALYYALGAYLLHPRDHITVTIVQPRAEGAGIASAHYTADQLLAFGLDLILAAHDTLAPDAPLVPGEHCRFCAALPLCPAVHARAVDTAQAEMRARGTELMDLRTVLQTVDEFIADWVSSVRAYALELLKQGRDVPGYKLVDKRAAREWAQDEATTVQYLIKRFKLKRSELFSSKLLSPAQIEERVGKGKLPDQLVTKRSSGVTMAPVSDPRTPATPPTSEPAGSEFFQGEPD